MRIVEVRVWQIDRVNGYWMASATIKFFWRITREITLIKMPHYCHSEVCTIADKIARTWDCPLKGKLNVL